MKLLTRFRKAAALPFVLLLVALNVVVVVALLVYATTELQASRNSVQAEAARAMAQSGIDIAAGLIAANSTNNGFVTYQRVTNVGGAWRLETKIANVSNNSSHAWTRQVTYPTALHSGFAAAGSGVDLNFAVQGDSNTGFILPRANLTNWQHLSGDMFRMQWIYIHDSNGKIVGRVAYWVDDESTKLNINYSGATNNYNASSFANDNWIRAYLFGPRGTVGAGAGLGQEFDGNLWPLFMELGGVAGLSRASAINILDRRGNPLWRIDGNSTTSFRPFSSPLEARLGTIPPASGGLALTNLSQQGQLGFTATIYSREPELSYSTGIPRFDMFSFPYTKDGEAAANAARISVATNEFVKSLTNNYPEFSTKYSLPQFVAAILSTRKSFGLGTAIPTNFPYVTSGAETTNYNNRGLPLVNESSVRLEVATDGTNQTAVLDAAVELIFLSGPDIAAAPSQYSLFDKLGVTGSAFTNARANYSATITFNPSIKYGTNVVAALDLTPTATWFTNSKGLTNCLKIYDQDLTGCFAVMGRSITNTTANATTNLTWQLPESITTSVVYGGKTYQTVSSTVPVVSTILTNQLAYSNSTKELVFQIISQTQGTEGVRGDPRIGLHTASCLAPTNASLLPVTATNSDASLGRLNNTWSPTNYAADPLSPDITPPYTVFESDRGLRYYYPTYFDSSGTLGEIPITTSKSGRHLAWSTPRFWGDGRTNMSGGPYPPDWLMLDCVHSAMFPQDTNRVFTGSTNGFLSFGRVNVNGLKSFFQIQKGSIDRADSVMDSVLIQAMTKDFRDYDTNNKPTNSGFDWLRIPAADAGRTNLLGFITNSVVQRGNSDNPYLTPYEFTAEIAGNPTIVGVTNWMANIPGATNVSERRIESLVRSLQQRLTAHGFQFTVYSLGQALQASPTGTEVTPSGDRFNVVGEAYLQAVYERAPVHDATTGAITNSPTGAPPMRQLYLRELRY